MNNNYSYITNNLPLIHTILESLSGKYIEFEYDFLYEIIQDKHPEFRDLYKNPDNFEYLNSILEQIK